MSWPRKKGILVSETSDHGASAQTALQWITCLLSATNVGHMEIIAWMENIAAEFTKQYQLITVQHAASLLPLNLPLQKPCTECPVRVSGWIRHTRVMHALATTSYLLLPIKLNVSALQLSPIIHHACSAGLTPVCFKAGHR